MDYEEAINWLYGRQQLGIKLGLDNIKKLITEIPKPVDELPIIHVAGTNGKGSTCAFIDSILRHCGKKTGLFTSPHLISFCERIRINGIQISEKEISKRISQIKVLVEGWDEEPTFFEITTALALEYFVDEKVDVAILEVGLGGRLDSTNIVNPKVCVITPISLDHQHILGETISEIAKEKAGIIKTGVPVVSAKQKIEAKYILESKSAEIKAPLLFVNDSPGLDKISLKGKHQRENASLAIGAVKTFLPDIKDQCCVEGIGKTIWRGRFEKLTRDNESDIIIDGAHNKDGAFALVSTWIETYGNEKATVIFAAAANKDLKSMVESIAEIAAVVILTEIDATRKIADHSDISRYITKDKEIKQTKSVNEAIELAKTFKSKILIAGSLFLVGEALAILDNKSQLFEPSDQ